MRHQPAIIALGRLSPGPQADALAFELAVVLRQMRLEEQRLAETVRRLRSVNRRRTYRMLRTS